MHAPEPRFLLIVDIPIMCWASPGRPMAHAPSRPAVIARCKSGALRNRPQHLSNESGPGLVDSGYLHTHTIYFARYSVMQVSFCSLAKRICVLSLQRYAGCAGCGRGSGVQNWSAADEKLEGCRCLAPGTKESQLVAPACR